MMAQVASHLVTADRIIAGTPLSSVSQVELQISELMTSSTITIGGHAPSLVVVSFVRRSYVGESAI